MHHRSSFPASYPIKNKSEQGGMTPLAACASIRAYLPYAERSIDIAQPRRKSLIAPQDNNTFVKPIKQCFVKNPRLMPMTRIMLTLLSGWAGQGGSIETTIGIIAKHIGRCRRQVFRYLRDALEEGYLYYSKTKDRIGRYTGIRIKLNFAAIRFTRTLHNQKRSKTAQMLDVTYPSDTNSKFIFNKDSDPDMWDKLNRFAASAGFSLPDI